MRLWRSFDRSNPPHQKKEGYASLKQKQGSGQVSFHLKKLWIPGLLAGGAEYPRPPATEGENGRSEE